MAASDATPFPIKNQAFRVTFPILDADGDLVTGATGLDSEVSKDAGTFADCTNEATEIATNSGVYYLDLTATEMNADTVAIIVKTSSSGAKTTTIILNPVENGLDIPVDVRYFGGTAATTSGGRPEVNTTHAAGTAWGSGAITAASIASDAITAAKIATGAIDADAIAADAITAAKIADGAIDAATFAASAITATVLANDCITDAKISGLAIAEIQSGLATSSAVSGIDSKVDIVDTVVDAIKAKTDNLPAAPAATGDIPSAATIATAVVGETMTELASIPGASPTLKQAIALLYMALRNKVDIDATTKEIHTDAGTVLATKTLSDNGTTYTEAKMA